LLGTPNILCLLVKKIAIDTYGMNTVATRITKQLEINEKHHRRKYSHETHTAT